MSGITQGLLASYKSWVSGKAFQVDTAWTLTTGLQAYYKMEDNTDYWGTNNATATGITYAAWKVNNGSVYNGSSKFSTYAQSIGTADFTIACWYKASGASWNPSVWSNNNWGNYCNAIFIWTTLYFEIFSNNCTYAAPLDWAWHLLICSRSGSNMYMYIDNSQVATSGSVTQNGWSATMVFWGRPFDGNTLFTWSLDEAWIWTKALSSQERTDLWNGGAGQTMV